MQVVGMHTGYRLCYNFFFLWFKKERSINNNNNNNNLLNKFLLNFAISIILLIYM